MEGRSLKNIRASTGFKPVTSTIPVRCSTNWAVKPHIRSEVNLLSCKFSIKPLKPWYFSGFILPIAQIGNLLWWSLFTFIISSLSILNGNFYGKEDTIANSNLYKLHWCISWPYFLVLQVEILLSCGAQPE